MKQWGYAVKRITLKTKLMRGFFCRNTKMPFYRSVSKDIGKVHDSHKKINITVKQIKLYNEHGKRQNLNCCNYSYELCFPLA